MRQFFLITLLLALTQFCYSQIHWVPLIQKTYSNEDIYSIRLNAVYTDDLVLYNYERLIPLCEKTALGYSF